MDYSLKTLIKEEGVTNHDSGNLLWMTLGWYYYLWADMRYTKF